MIEGRRDYNQSIMPFRGRSTCARPIALPVNVPGHLTHNGTSHGRRGPDVPPVVGAPLPEVTQAD
jgi:hypothetical protein